MFPFPHPAARPAPEAAAVTANHSAHPLLLLERDDDPPPYPASEEGGVEAADHNGSINALEEEEAEEEEKITVEDIRDAILGKPINDDEAEKIAVACSKFVRPGDLYYIEAICEAERIEAIGYPTPSIFQGGREAIMRKGVWVRHNIKRRWEKLGIWNPNWGFAGRRLDASDDFTKWTWRWQPDGAGDGDSPGHYARGLVLRALRLRQNLLRGECAPVMPRSHLEPDALADTAEAFLISRPCFLFQLEVAEEQMRFARLLAPWIKGSYPSSTPREQVIKWWKKRGDWKDEYYGDGVYEKEYNYEFYRSKEHGTVTAWKWRHESPSPEPESLTPIEENRQWHSSIGMAEFMNFAPEEIDELADIDTHLLRPEDPWIKGAYGPPEPLVPGQCRLLPGEDRWKPVEYVWDTRPIPPHDPSLPRLGILDDLRAEQQARIASKEQEESADPEPDAVTPPPPKRRRLRHHQPDDKANEPRPRRSARVTGMKRPAEPLPQEIAPNKRTRTRESARAAAPIVAASSAPPPPRQTRGIKTKLVPTQSQPPPQEHAETQVKRGRGRPRKESMPSARPPTERKKKTPSARPTPARAERTTASGAGASGTPRPRGRPRKDGGPGPHPSAKNKASAAPAGTRSATKGTAAGTDVPGVRKRRGRPRKSG